MTPTLPGFRDRNPTTIRGDISLPKDGAAVDMLADLSRYTGQPPCTCVTALLEVMGHEWAETPVKDRASLISAVLRRGRKA